MRVPKSFQMWNPFTYLPDDAAASLPDLYEACPELLDFGL